MEIPCLELEDPKLAKRVMDLVAPLVITAEKQEKMIEVLEKELDLGLQHGLSGQASVERQNNVCLVIHPYLNRVREMSIGCHTLCLFLARKDTEMFL